MVIGEGSPPRADDLGALYEPGRQDVRACDLLKLIALDSGQSNRLSFNGHALFAQLSLRPNVPPEADSRAASPASPRPAIPALAPRAIASAQVYRNTP